MNPRPRHNQYATFDPQTGCVTDHSAPHRAVPAPPPPKPTPTMVAQLRLDAQLREVDDAFAFRTAVRRSSQEAATALLEVMDAALAQRALCPVGDVIGAPPEEQARARAAKLRLDEAITRARTAGATETDIDAVMRGVPR